MPMPPRKEIHRWSMRGVDNRVAPTNTLCGQKVVRKQLAYASARVTCPECRRLSDILDRRDDPCPTVI